MRILNVTLRSPGIFEASFSAYSLIPGWRNMLVECQRRRLWSSSAATTFLQFRYRRF